MTSILIVGSSGHAKVVVDIVHNEGRFKIVGLVDSFSVVGESAVGYSVLGGEQDIGRIADSRHLAGYLIAVGDNFARAGICERISVIAPGLPLVSAVHPRAVLAESVYVGAGTVVMAGAVVNPGRLSADAASLIPMHRWITTQRWKTILVSRRVSRSVAIQQSVRSAQLESAPLWCTESGSVRMWSWVPERPLCKTSTTISSLRVCRRGH